MWMTAVYPIGLVIAHVLLGVVYFGWITPVGLLMRLFGRDPMHRRLDRSAASYWVRRRPASSASQYFRQY
jgi:hypothetical protein